MSDNDLAKSFDLATTEENSTETTLAELADPSSLTLAEVAELTE